MALVLFQCPRSFCAPEDSAAVDFPPKQPDATIISYRFEPPPRSLSKLQERYGPEQIALLEKLNRADARHLASLKVLVIPDRWDLEERQYSPLPQRYSWGEQYRKLLVVFLPGQVFGGYEGGRLVRWGPISSGTAEDPTQPGFFHLNWKSPGRHSTENPEWFMRWYYNFANCEGRALHAYPLPGYPASHACIRLLERDARWLYHWGESWELGSRTWEILRQGTPLLILGQYPFRQLQQPLWLSPQWLAQGIELPSEPVSGEPLPSEGCQPPWSAR